MPPAAGSGAPGAPRSGWKTAAGGAGAAAHSVVSHEAATAGAAAPHHQALRMVALRGAAGAQRARSLASVAGQATAMTPPSSVSGNAAELAPHAPTAASCGPEKWFHMCSALAWQRGWTAAAGASASGWKSASASFQCTG